MSWTISFIGKPENVVAALEQQSEKMDGQSKVEYDAALPHFVALVKENFASTAPLLKITASGHGHDNNYRQCTVNIEYVYVILV